jgi:hypothetical protein
LEPTNKKSPLSAKVQRDFLSIALLSPKQKKDELPLVRGFVLSIYCLG